MKTPILGGSLVAQSSNIAYNRLVNLYAEAVPEGGKEPGFLTRVPGNLLLASVGAGPIRGLYEYGGYGYVVSGTELYKIDTNFTATKLGDVAGTGPVSMADNGTQLFIATNPEGYIYNANTGAFGLITDPDFPGSATVVYFDGYFVFNEPNSQRYWVTALLDGTSIDPLEFSSAEGIPDNLQVVAVDHKTCWLFGVNSVEAVYNSGALDFPLSPIEGAYIETGCVAPYSVTKLDNSLFWLGSDKRGTGVVFRLNGYTAARVSDHMIEAAIQTYDKLEETIGFSYQQQGHTFLVLVFPDAGKTWVLDSATGLWHERASFSAGNFTRHPANCFMFFAGKHVIGDYQNSNLYAYDQNTFTDNGEPLKWVRSWRAIPTGKNFLKYTRHHRLTLDIETGVGLNAGQGSDPQIMLRWSDDHGKTWSNEHLMDQGRLGDYLKRMYRDRLGVTRDRIYEISGTDPVKVNILSADLDIGKVD